MSWQWIYNYKHAPSLKDLSKYLNKLDNINNLKINKGTPNKPYQQLLMVLPPESHNLLPKSYQHLVLLDSSPIIDYYPKEYELDCYYKRYYWECTPVLPLINIKRIRNILSKINLTKLESNLNKIGKDYVIDKTIHVI